MSDAESQLRGPGDLLRRIDAALRVTSGDELDAIVRELSTRVQRLAQELRAVRGELEAAEAASGHADAS
ncbi:MAG: hypothetical protein IAG13_01985 [Deltaproteobacteria bacterium]|nr:hypothetical protein [Nannocystaceae bacterium]